MTYEIQCRECKIQGKSASYFGETSRTHFDRMEEHQDNLRRKSEESPLFQHWQVHHNAKKEPPAFECKLLGTHKSATERQLKVALAIAHNKCNILLNSKSEFGRNALVHQQTARDGSPVREEVQGMHLSPKRKKCRRSRPEASLESASEEYSVNEPPEVIQPPASRMTPLEVLSARQESASQSQGSRSRRQGVQSWLKPSRPEDLGH